MPRPGVTRDQVFEAADALADEGIQPTTKLVRDRTGGSFSTITPHRAAWKDERGGRAVANIPDMPEGVAGAARAMWATAWNAAQDAIKSERDGLSAARREMDKERAELAQEIGELESKLDVAETERANLASTLADEEKRHREAEQKLGDPRSRTPASRSASQTPRSAPTSCATRSPA
jgi:colicin import membrane protein